jgi:RND family efflux transporter MFP subunit
MIGLLLVVLIITGLLPRWHRRTELAAMAKARASARSVVTVVRPQPAPESRELVLPGTAQAAQETIISARANGFVSRYLVDIGTRVRAGQLLAEIDTPELDQQVAQARQEVESASQEVAQARQELEQAHAAAQQAEAELEKARTSAELARVTLNRSRSLLASGAVTQQMVDEQQAAFDASKAAVTAAQATIHERQAAISAKQATLQAQQSALNARRANVQRLLNLQSFRRVTAPYSGVITQRNVEAGSLVAASGGVAGGTGNDTGGAANGSGLFRLARIDEIRLFVDVPQSYIAAISVGQQVTVEVRDLPQQQYPGRVVRTANALDRTSRTLPVEILIENKAGQLMPGMYAQVKFNLQNNQRALLVPGSAIVMRADGPQVIVVGKDGSAHYAKVTIGRDYGSQVEILSGLAADDQVVTNPTDALQEGQKVEALDGRK